MTTVSNLLLIVLLLLALAEIFAFGALIAICAAIKNGATLTFGYEEDEDK